MRVAKRNVVLRNVVALSNSIAYSRERGVFSKKNVGFLTVYKISLDNKR